ncbi:MAG: hypothetical protein JST91_15280 [Actinobacteria bacterium]|nr:hypothetical protein [Actinomycetota bacterium]
MTLKSFLTGVAAAGLVGAAAAGVTSLAPGAMSASPAVQPVVFGIPMPQQPVPGVPTTDQVMTVLNGLGNPNVPFRSKSGLIEGGVGIVEGRTADRLVANAVQEGYFPLSFSVADITPAGPGTATAQVTASGPALAPVTQTVTFVDEGGWKLSRASGLSLLQSALA